MKNLISLVEIPILDPLRAVSFYKNILNINIEEVDIDGTLIWFFLHENEEQTVCLVKDENAAPSPDGTVIYFNADGNIESLLTEVQKHGGQIITHKTEIGPGMGCFAHIRDTEGNKIGLFSQI